MQNQNINLDPSLADHPTTNSRLASIEQDLTCNILQTLWALRVRTSVDRTQANTARTECLQDTHHLAWDAYEAVHRCATELRQVLEAQSSALAR